MNYSIGKTISKAIKENKWLSIEYVNKNSLESTFWCAVLDINIDKKSFTVDIFNIFKGLDSINTYIMYENIKSAKVLDGTYYIYDEKLNIKTALSDHQLEYIRVKNDFFLKKEIHIMQKP